MTTMTHQRLLAISSYCHVTYCIASQSLQLIITLSSDKMSPCCSAVYRVERYHD